MSKDRQITKTCPHTPLTGVPAGMPKTLCTVTYISRITHADPCMYTPQLIAVLHILDSLDSFYCILIVPNAVSLKYPSPLGPNPEPGVPTTFAFSSR